MTKQKAIKQFCSECSGGAFKDLALCTDPRCPLWPFRLGCGLKSSRYRSAMAGIKDRYPGEIEDLGRYGLKWSDYVSTDAANTALKNRRGARRPKTAPVLAEKSSVEIRG